MAGLLASLLACSPNPSSSDLKLGDPSGSDTSPQTDTESSPDPEDTDDTDTTVDTAPPDPDPVNLLQNPGFENGDAPWNIWGGAQRIEHTAQEGTWSIQATNHNGAEQLVEGLSPNTTYRLSGWGKTDGTNPMSIGVKFHGNNQARALFTDSVYTENGLSFTTGFANTSAIIYAYKPGGEEAGYADNLSLTYESESDYLLAWSDEFNGTGALDTTRWGFEEGFVRNEELQWYQSENAFQEGGHLVIEGRTESRPNPNYAPGSTSWKTSRSTIEYTSSSIITKDLFEWQYGRIVVRAKVTNLLGTWPAIWTLGTDCSWPSNGEVDIMENYQGDILANFAWGTHTAWTPSWDSSHWAVSELEEGWADEFHLWEMDWTSENMTILLDGQVLNTVALTDTINGSAECEGQNPFQQPHYLLINLALGGAAGGSVENLPFPTRYLVDYIRIYQ